MHSSKEEMKAGLTRLHVQGLTVTHHEVPLDAAAAAELQGSPKHATMQSSYAAVHAVS